jgi:hypothetical protein
MRVGRKPAALLTVWKANKDDAVSHRRVRRTNGRAVLKHMWCSAFTYTRTAERLLLYFTEFVCWVIQVCVYTGTAPARLYAITSLHGVPVEGALIQLVCI